MKTALAALALLPVATMAQDLCDARGQIAAAKDPNDTLLVNHVGAYTNIDVLSDGNYGNIAGTNGIWRGIDITNSVANQYRFSQFLSIAVKDDTTISSATIKVWVQDATNTQNSYSDKFNHDLRVFYSLDNITTTDSTSANPPTGFTECGGSWTLNPGAINYAGWVANNNPALPVHSQFIAPITDDTVDTEFYQFTCDPGADFKFIYLMGPTNINRYLAFAEIEMESAGTCANPAGGDDDDDDDDDDSGSCDGINDATQYQQAGCCKC